MPFRVLPKCQHRRRSAYRCPAVVLIDQSRRLVGALVSASAFQPVVRVVAQGIDTLHLFTVRPLTQAWAERLSTLRASAEESGHGRRPSVTVGGLELQVAPHGVAGAKYLLESDLWAFKVSPSPAPQHPTVQVELRALGLWANGWRRAAELALEAAADLCGVSVDELDAQVSRADLAVDIQGWEPRPEDLELFTTRASSRGAHAGSSWAWLETEAGREAHDRRRAAKLEVAQRLRSSKSRVEQAQLMLELEAQDDPNVASIWRAGRHLTGFSFGRGAIAARLYDKRREIGVSGKHWMRTVWRGWNPLASVATHGQLHYQPPQLPLQLTPEAGALSRYLEDAEVWRLEFQLRREAVKALEEVQAPEPGADWPSYGLGSWAHFAGRVDSVWRYLTHRWLRHGRRQEDDRQAASSVWRQLQGAWCAGEPSPVNLHRPAVDAARVVVVPQLAGLLATAAAQVSVLSPAHSSAQPAPYWRTLLAAVRAAHAYAELKEEPLKGKVQVRAAKLATRGGQLQGSTRAHQARVSAAARLCGAQVRRRWWEEKRWKAEPVRFVPGAGFQGGTVEMSAENTVRTPWQAVPTSEVGH